LTARLHSHHTLVPTANHFTAAHLEAERIVAVAGAVELLALVIGRGLGIQPACVVNDGRLAAAMAGPLPALTSVISSVVGAGVGTVFSLAAATASVQAETSSAAVKRDLKRMLTRCVGGCGSGYARQAYQQAVQALNVVCWIDQLAAFG